MGRLVTAAILVEVLGRGSRWRSASWVGLCLCGLWTLGEPVLALVECAYDGTEGRFVCRGEVTLDVRQIEKADVALTVKQAPRWLTVTAVSACLEVCLVVVLVAVIWRRHLHWRKRLVPCAAVSSRLL